jgi:hypothetical protein
VRCKEATRQVANRLIPVSANENSPEEMIQKYAFKASRFLSQIGHGKGSK